MSVHTPDTADHGNETTLSCGELLTMDQAVQRMPQQFHQLYCGVLDRELKRQVAMHMLMRDIGIAGHDYGNGKPKIEISLREAEVVPSDVEQKEVASLDSSEEENDGTNPVVDENMMAATGWALAE